MRISAGTGVTLHYTLTVNGRVVDATPAGEPLFFVQGERMILPGVESALEGLQAGERRRVVLPPEQGFGEIRQELFREVDRSCFHETAELHPGTVIDAHDAEGEFLRAEIHSVRGNVVLLNCNHPLAGQTLTYDVEVLKIEPLKG